MENAPVAPADFGARAVKIDARKIAPLVYRTREHARHAWVNRGEDIAKRNAKVRVCVTSIRAYV